MPDCEHLHLRLDSIGEPGNRGVRTVRLICKDCGDPIDMLTTRTDEEIAAEMEAAQ